MDHLKDVLIEKITISYASELIIDCRTFIHFTKSYQIVYFHWGFGPTEQLIDISIISPSINLKSKSLKTFTLLFSFECLKYFIDNFDIHLLFET